ncbi:hypothetical protein [Tepidibacillus fermentans]|uniref:Uncharacterized protein n=1 Tax=Tepidibacillus fermentans TaxID=1281767 RepID=A0A4R3KDJ3_9BACI|nr:hypothetical protein [Tepidibacillus fermentans]TCS81257.1 hypothetical protein EDD72_11315 [Tepidibacillus fermentans]
MFKQMYQKFFHIVHTSVLRIGKQLVFGLAIGILLLFVFAKLVEDLLFNELGIFDTIVTQYIQSFTSPNVTKMTVSPQWSFYGFNNVLWHPSTF